VGGKAGVISGLVWKPVTGSRASWRHVDGVGSFTTCRQARVVLLVGEVLCLINEIKGFCSFCSCYGGFQCGRDCS